MLHFLNRTAWSFSCTLPRLFFGAELRPPPCWDNKHPDVKIKHHNFRTWKNRWKICRPLSVSETCDGAQMTGNTRGWTDSCCAAEESLSHFCSHIQLKCNDSSTWPKNTQKKIAPFTLIINCNYALLIWMISWWLSEISGYCHTQTFLSHAFF